MNKVLEIKHCNKSFGENEVLKDISLSVTEGQVVSIIGLPALGNPPFCAAQPCWKPWTAAI